MSILDLVGNTPLIRLSSLSKETSGVGIYAKAEYFNPSGSVKDRAARAMLLDGIKRGALTRHKTILDATSGNTGIAFAMMGAALGYRVKLFLPSNCSLERKRMMRLFGAEVVETSPLEGSDGALLAAREAAQSRPECYFYPNQYDNPANSLAHYETTAVEIWNQTHGKVTHFIAGMGTSGTFMGVTRRLKEYNKDIRAIAVQPDSPFHGIEGTKHMASTILPGIYDQALIDSCIQIRTEDAYTMTRGLAREEGLFVGISSGGNAYAALSLAQTLPEGSVVVTVLCDSGARYLSDSFWDE
ncbi:MAG: cysteine synthase family protein [Clostridiales bacterium]|jgi:cysteine synthase B|nr:cysteine synthase family protein [Clostridiales bacterium]